MNDYQFVASTVDGEKKTSLLGAVALLAPAALLLLLLKGLLPNLITNQGLLWLVVFSGDATDAEALCGDFYHSLGREACDACIAGP